MATPEDCLDWVIDSILYTLDKHVWTDEGSSMYKDPKAPEKCINVCIKSTRANYYISKNRQKRKVALQTISLEFLEKIANDDSTDVLEVVDCYEANKDFIARRIIYYFERYEFFKAFVLHQITHEDFVKSEDPVSLKVEFDYFSCKRSIRSFNDIDCQYFSYLYGIPLDRVRQAVETVKRMSYYEMQCSVDSLFDDLRHDTSFIELLRSS